MATYKRSLTLDLIGVITVAYILAWQSFDSTLHKILPWMSLGLQDQLLLVQNAIFSDGSVHGVGSGEWYRIFTVALTHASITHLGFNMLALYSLGTSVENYYGKTKYVFILLVSLVTASLASLYFNAPNQLAVGASGMIFGLFSTLLITGRRMGVEWRSVAVVVGINIAMNFTIPNIDWRAHLGGLAGGALATVLVRAIPTRR